MKSKRILIWYLALAIICSSGLLVRTQQETGSDSLSGNLETAKAFLKQDQKRNALPFLNAALSEGPSAEARYLRGTIYLSFNKFKAARQDAEHLIRAYPDNWRGYLLRSKLFLARDQDENEDRLRSDLNNVLSLNPDQKEARVLRGLYYWRHGHNKKAVADFKQVPERTRKTVSASRAAAQAAFCEGRTGWARTMAEQVREVVPDDLTASRILYFVKQNVKSNVERTFQHAERWKRRGKLDRARSVGNTLLQESRASSVRAFAYLFRARLKFQSGQLDEAKRLARKAEKLGDQIALTVLLIGDVLKRKGNYNRAAKAYRDAYYRNAELNRARIEHGICLSKIDRHERAVEMLSNGMDHLMIHPEGAQHLVQSCIEVGFLVFARSLLDRFSFSSEEERRIRRRISRELQKRRNQEQETFENQRYHNDYYGIALPLPEHWTYADDPGRPGVVALFSSTRASDKLVLTAQRIPPTFQETSLNSKNNRERLREHLISTKLFAQEVPLTFEYEEAWQLRDSPGMHLLLTGPEKSDVHLFVLFSDSWMFTFYYMAESSGSYSTRMKRLLQKVKIENK